MEKVLLNYISQDGRTQKRLQILSSWHFEMRMRVADTGQGKIPKLGLFIAVLTRSKIFLSTSVQLRKNIQ